MDLRDRLLAVAAVFEFSSNPDKHEELTILMTVDLLRAGKLYTLDKAIIPANIHRVLVPEGQARQKCHHGSIVLPESSQNSASRRVDDEESKNLKRAAARGQRHQKSGINKAAGDMRVAALEDVGIR